MITSNPDGTIFEKDRAEYERLKEQYPEEYEWLANGPAGYLYFDGSYILFSHLKFHDFLTRSKAETFKINQKDEWFIRAMLGGRTTCLKQSL